VVCFDPTRNRKRKLKRKKLREKKPKEKFVFKIPKKYFERNKTPEK